VYTLIGDEAVRPSDLHRSIARLLQFFSGGWSRGRLGSCAVLFPGADSDELSRERDPHLLARAMRPPASGAAKDVASTRNCVARYSSSPTLRVRVNPSARTETTNRAI
jgi:hypothetical protein